MLCSRTPYIRIINWVQVRAVRGHTDGSKNFNKRFSSCVNGVVRVNILRHHRCIVLSLDLDSFMNLVIQDTDNKISSHTPN